MTVFELLPYVAATLACAMALWATWRANRRTRARVESLARSVGAFSDASMHLARTVEQVMFAPRADDGAQPAAVSRRYLLQRARAEIELGHAPAAVAERLGLSSSERRLLSLVSAGGLSHPADQRP